MHDRCQLAERLCPEDDEEGARESTISGRWYVSYLIRSMELIETVFDPEEAAESELRLLFTLADIDELWVASLSSFCMP